MTKQLKIAVIGGGVFGNYHSGKVAAHPLATLVAIVDPDLPRAEALATTHKTQACATLDEVLDTLDAVIIAVPAKYHGGVGTQALRAGKHVLIEKPIAADLKSASEMIAAAQAGNLVLQVGHQERFVARAIGLYDVPETPTQIISKRMSPYSPRNTDVSVTLDLMTHDIDLVLSLMGTPTSVSGQSTPVKSQKPDTANGRLEFANAGVATLQASRIADASTRTMDITYPSGTVHIDFNKKTLTHTTPFDLNLEFGASPEAKDSLGTADDAFIRSCLNGDPVVINGEDGAAALKIALQIDGDI